MNAYFVDAGVVTVCVEDLGELGRIYDDERVVDVVFAETRGQAQYRFWQRQLAEEGALHEFTYRVRLLARGVDPATADMEALWDMTYPDSGVVLAPAEEGA